MRHPTSSLRNQVNSAFVCATLLGALCLSAPTLALDPPNDFLPPSPNPAAAPAQPPTPPPKPTPSAPTTTPPAPTGPTASDAIRELQASYRNTTTCERVQIEVRYPAPAPATGTRTARSTISVQLSGDPKADTETPQSIALELGALRIFASRGQLTAIHSRDPSTYFQAAIDDRLTSSALSAALPPVLIPALDLKAAPADAPCNAFSPYATDIVWQSIETDPKHPSKRTIRGACNGGTVVLIAQNQRLRSLTIDLLAKKTVLALTFSPFGPCDLSKATIDVSRRQRVDSMDELRPRSSTLRVGVRVPNMPITQGLGGQGWDMGGLLQPPLAATAAGVRPADHVVLVFLRQTPLTTPAADQRFSPDALAKQLKAMREDAFRARTLAQPPQSPDSTLTDKDPAAAIAKFGFAPVFVLNNPQPEDILRQVRDAGSTWPEVLWTTEAKSTIDLFAPTADGVCVILDAEYVLRAVIPIEPSQTAEQVSDQITASLFELGAGDK